MINNNDIWKEVLFGDLDGMSKSDRYKTLFVVLLYLPLVLILLPIVSIRSFRRRNNDYRQVSEYSDAQKSTIEHNSENDDAWKKEEYDQQAESLVIRYVY